MIAGSVATSNAAGTAPPQPPGKPDEHKTAAAPAAASEPTQVASNAPPPATSSVFDTPAAGPPTEPNNGAVPANASGPADLAANSTDAGKTRAPRGMLVPVDGDQPTPDPPAPGTHDAGEKASDKPAGSNERTAPNDQAQQPDRGAKSALPGGQRDGLAPLPSKEEIERQIQEEAAKKQAEIAAQLKNRDEELRAHIFDDRIKFRDELQQLLRLDVKHAGPEIDALAKRHDGDCDPTLFENARRFWAAPRPSQVEKVRKLRLANVPEATILNFLSGDIHARIGMPHGPRDTYEVRVLAARKLMTFEFPEKARARAALRPATRPERTAPKCRQPRALAGVGDRRAAFIHTMVRFANNKVL